MDLKDINCGVYFRWPTILAIVSVISLGILVIAVFLVTRTGCRSSSSTCKTLHDDSTDPRTLPPVPTLPLPPPPCFTPSVTYSSCDISSRPPAFLPVRHMAPAPSPTHQALLPADWMFPSHYDDDIGHWYTTVGSDGCEYLTREPPPMFSKTKCHMPHIRQNNSFRQANPSAPSTVESVDIDKYADALTYI